MMITTISHSNDGDSCVNDGGDGSLWMQSKHCHSAKAASVVYQPVAPLRQVNNLGSPTPWTWLTQWLHLSGPLGTPVCRRNGCHSTAEGGQQKDATGGWGR